MDRYINLIKKYVLNFDTVWGCLCLYKIYARYTIEL